MVSDKAIRQGIYQKLNVASVTTLLGSGSASLVHHEAPPSSAYPLCVFWKPSGVSENAFGIEAFRNQLWGVKGVVKATSASTAEDIDKAVYDLLHMKTLTIAGAQTVTAARESDVNYPETTGDVVFKHVGGIYRLRIHT